MVYSDEDSETGFVLLPDIKWDQKEVENLYMLAVVRKRGLLSLRELNDTHLPLLRNVLHKGKASLKKYVYTCTYLYYQIMILKKGLNFSLDGQILKMLYFLESQIELFQIAYKNYSYIFVHF